MKKLVLGVVLFVAIVAGGIAGFNYEKANNSTYESALRAYDDCIEGLIMKVGSSDNKLYSEVIKEKEENGETYVLVKTGEEAYRIMTKEHYRLWLM